MGRPRTLPDAQPRACAFCDKVFTPDRKKWRQKYCCLNCNGRAFCNPEHNRRVGRQYAAKIGDAMRDRGEGRSYRKRGGRHEHRVVMEQMLGRKLLPGEVVHHKDENKRNNDPDNLELLPSQSEHARLHAPAMVAKRLANYAAKKRQASCPQGCEQKEMTLWDYLKV